MLISHRKLGLAIGHTDAHIQQHGAAEARRAHNPEDVGSKPTVATFCFLVIGFLRLEVFCTGQVSAEYFCWKLTKGGISAMFLTWQEKSSRTLWRRGRNPAVTLGATLEGICYESDLLSSSQRAQ